MSLLTIENLSYAYGDYSIFHNANLELYKHDHMGIVGPNGAGKSTLIKLCTHELSPDNGKIIWQPHKKIGHLDQYANINQEFTIYEFLQTAFTKLYKIEKQLLSLYENMYVINNNWETIEKYQEQLDAANFYQIDTEIEKIANGLGLSSIGLSKKITQISGGQRAKVVLGKLLLEKPDVLLLDEPTNFLDIEHIDWLSQILCDWDQAFMVISHDYHFLEKISNCICDIDHGELHKYIGKYSNFLKQKIHSQKEYQRRFESQQKYIKKTEAFIQKNIAGSKSKSARGRRKQLEKIERLTPPSHTKAPPIFHFQCNSSGHYQQIIANKLSIGYSQPLFAHLDMTINKQDKIVITGFNGIGKSTLLKTLIQRCLPLEGTITITENLEIGYYDQDLYWEDTSIPPIKAIANKYPMMVEKEIRKHLSRCGISNDHMTQAIQSLSGGEQAKLKLCLLTLQPYHILILDEPTNHLDNTAKEALKKALKAYNGSILLVSHEKEFYQELINKEFNMVKWKK